MVAPKVTRCRSLQEEAAGIPRSSASIPGLWLCLWGGSGEAVTCPRSLTSLRLSNGRRALHTQLSSAPSLIRSSQLQLQAILAKSETVMAGTNACGPGWRAQSSTHDLCSPRRPVCSCAARFPPQVTPFCSNRMILQEQSVFFFI